MKKTNRYSKTEKTEVAVNQPRLIHNYNPVFSKHEEDKLVKLVVVKSLFVCLTTTVVVRKLAYQLAEKNSKSHNFNRNNIICYMCCIIVCITNNYQKVKV